MRNWLLGLATLTLTACQPPAVTPPSSPIAAAPTSPATPVAPTPASQATLRPARETSPPAPTAPVSLCRHSYMPVRTGTEWRYRTQGAVASEMRETRTPTAAAGFLSRMELAESTVEQQWRCTPEGLVALQLSTVSMPQSQLRFVASSVSGVTLPPEDRLKPGAQWDLTYEVEGSGSPADGNRAQGRITVSHTVHAEEPVAVPAGTFGALRITQQFSLDLTVRVRDFSSPMSLSFETVSWLARDVGLVKSTGGGEMGETVTELVAFTR